MDDGSRVEFVVSAVQVGGPRKRNLFSESIEQGRRLKGLIEPLGQVAIDEQLLAQQSGEIGTRREKTTAASG